MPTILDTLGIAACTISYGKEGSFAGRLATVSIQVTPKAIGINNLRLTWAATGDMFSGFVDSSTGTSGTPGIIVLPQTGQTGFQHGTTTFKDWYYEAVVTAVLDDGQQLSRVYRFQIPAGTTALDLDMLDEDGVVTILPAIAPILAEPAGLSADTRASLAAAYLQTWKPNTPYVEGQSVLSPSGSVVVALKAFTSGSTFDASKWTDPNSAIPLRTQNEIVASGLPSSDPTLLPFSGNSVWRLGIAKQAKFAPVADARNSAIADVDGTGQAWINRTTYSHPITFASSTDPLATVTDPSHFVDGVPEGGTWFERIPAAARIAAGSDQHMHIIDPERLRVIEHFAVTRNSPTSYLTYRRHEVSLVGSGIGPQNGCRAYGGSAIGGLIRAWEVDPTHPYYTGRIDHPLAIALRLGQLYYSGVSLPAQGGNEAYGLDGYGLKLGYTWPATEQDYQSPFQYGGPIPMGSYFAIPSSVDLSTLGLTTTQGLMLARALQDYGAYITDASGVSAFYVEDDGGAATQTFVDTLLKSDLSAPDVRVLFKALKVVTSNSPTTPNGGLLGAPRRGNQEAVTPYPAMRSTPPNPLYSRAYIDISTVPPKIKGWDGSDWIDLRPDTVPPSTPGVPTATGGLGYIDLAWTASTDDVAIAKYRIYRSDAPTTILATPTTNAYRDYSATLDTAYTYTVLAVDTGGNKSAKTAASNSATATATPPAAPTGVIGSADDGRVYLDWTASTANGSPVTDYVVQYSTDQSAWSTFPHAASTATSQTVTGLTNSAYYYFRIAGVNVKGPGAYSNIAGPFAPSAMRTFTTDSFTDTEGTLLTAHSGETGASWTLNAGNTAPVSVRVNRNNRLWHSASANAWVQASGVPDTADCIVEADLVYASLVNGQSSGITLRASNATVTNYTFQYWGSGGAWRIVAIQNGVSTSLAALATPLQPGLTYRMKFVAKGTQLLGYVNGALVCSATDSTITAAGFAGLMMTGGTVGFSTSGMLLDNFTARSALIVADTTAPTVPGTPTATGSTNQIALTWAGSTDNAAVAGYRIYRSDAPTTVLGTTTATSYTDTTATPGTAYTYTVAAYDGSGNASAKSAASNPATAVAVTHAFQDSFTGSAGALESHTPEAGTGWTALSAGVVLDGSGRIRGNAAFCSSIAAGTWANNQTAQAEVTIVTATNNAIGVLVRASYANSNTNLYQLRYSSGSGQWVLGKIVNNTSSSLQAYTPAVAPSAGTAFKLSATGTTITATIYDGAGSGGGPTVITLTDSSVGSGRPGVTVSAADTNTTGLRLDNFVAD